MADLSDGETVEVQGSARSPYVLRNVGGVYSCTCPAWRNQSIAIERRTCKHLRKLRGEEAEKLRIGEGLPATAAPPTKDPKDVPGLLLAHTWENDADLAGWWLSEKLDGVRAYWDGRRFLSRQGNVFHAPDWFVADLPPTPLDGELWLGRKAFQRTVSIVRRQDKSDLWRELQYVVFDLPAAPGPFEERQRELRETLRAAGEFASLLGQQPCRGLEHLREELARINALGGEGLMLRQPGSRYEAGRSGTLLKVKTFIDAEARVVEHLPGAGRHKGRLGALAVELPDGTSFSIGTGFSDAQRESPPALGSVVTFRYQELSDRGVPRFPSFVRLREEEGEEVQRPRDEGPEKKTGYDKRSSVTPPGSIPAMSKSARHFEFVDGAAAKFWEIAIEGTDVTVRFGRIGANGQTQTKSFADAAAAQKHADKLVAEKTGKGYVESGGG